MGRIEYHMMQLVPDLENWQKILLKGGVNANYSG
jgi:hypothetical protein